MRYTPENRRNRASHAVDTTFVMFFLAVEMGRTITVFDINTALIATTLMSFIILPYFLAPADENNTFFSWLLGRGAISMFAMVLGWTFSLGIGTILSEAFAYLPMTLLIVTAMASSILQFYGLLALNTARK